MRPDDLYLADLLEACEAIERFLQGVGESDFLADEILASAVLQKLSVVGEAAARLSPEFRVAHASVPWRKLIGLRNVIVHQYFSLAWETVWITVKRDVPELARQLRSRP